TDAKRVLLPPLLFSDTDAVTNPLLNGHCFDVGLSQIPPVVTVKEQ
ncbi:hypothetical protein Tco_0229946, partial [Tanacetum coccineum]